MKYLIVPFLMILPALIPQRTFAQTTDSSRVKSNKDRMGRLQQDDAKKERNKKNISLKNFSWGLSYAQFLGGDETPFKNSLGLCVTHSKRVLGKKALLAFYVDVDFCTAANKEWYAKTADTTSTLIKKNWSWSGYECGIISFSNSCQHPESISFCRATSGISKGFITISHHRR